MIVQCLRWKQKRKQYKIHCTSIYMSIWEKLKQHCKISCTKQSMNRNNAWPLSSDLSCGRIAKNTDYVNQFLPSKVRKNSKNHCILWWMLELSGTTIVSPRGFFPLSLAPKGWRTQEWKHSQSSRRKTYLYNLGTKVTCVSTHNPVYDPTLHKRDAQMYTSSTPAEQQIRCHCYSKGCQPVGQCRKASCETLDANWEDLRKCKVWNKPYRLLTPCAQERLLQNCVMNSALQWKPKNGREASYALY